MAHQSLPLYYLRSWYHKVHELQETRIWEIWTTTRSCGHGTAKCTSCKRDPWEQSRPELTKAHEVLVGITQC